MTRLHWPEDPASTAGSPWLPEITTTFDERWWDFKAAANAANTLNESIAKMLVFQEGLLSSPETRDSYAAIKSLGDALVTAIPYIEWPFGPYERRSGFRRAKQWHTYALIIARLTIDELEMAGHGDRGITRNSVVVRVVQNALLRMRIPPQTLSKTAIGAFLTRWNKKYGLTRKAIQALTTKQARPAL